MAYVKNTMIIRRDLLSRFAKLVKEQRLFDDIDRIPTEMSPREKSAKRRCCVYKERAIIKYKMMPILGFTVDEEEDELTSLSTYTLQAYLRKEPRTKILTVVDEACTSCVKANYTVTNLCKGCEASPCSMNCPKDAISFDNNGKAHIDPSKCVNCGICQKACPYHSIVYVPVPCEEVCPVGAIKKDENGIERIDDDKCIYCGKCMNACPFGSIYEVSHLIDVFKNIQKGKKVIAIPAPAVMGQYKESTGKVVTAIKKLGFHDVVEVAEGALITTTNEANELKEKLEEGQKFMTTSCCPAYVQAVKKHIPAIAPFVSHTKSPMYYTAEIVKQQHPDAKVVFIGPCVAKRKEAIDDPNVDFVMTFEELDCFFHGYEINVADCEETPLKGISKWARGYAESGGVTAAVVAEGLEMDIKAVPINGIDKKSIKLFNVYAKGKVPGNFLEVMACEGGCIAGPATSIDSLKGKKLLKKEIVELEELNVCNEK